MEQTNTDAGTPAKRPTFLTVLCILTFVGVAFSLIGGIMNYFTYSALASGGDMLGGMGDGEMGEAMNSMMDAMGLDYGKMATVAIIQALLNIPILLGAIMMWKQKKTGFYVYTAFEIIQPLIPLFLGMGLMGGAMAVVGLVLAIAFIIMYGLNLKHMS